MLEKQLKKIKKLTIEYVNHVDMMMKSTIIAFKDKDISALETIMLDDEDTADAYEKRIQKKSLVLMSTESPRATLLRESLMIIKIINDLERMADNVANVCRCAIDLIEKPVSYEYIEEIKKMNTIISEMIADVTKSLANIDHHLAKKVYFRDIEVNEIRDNMNVLTLHKMMENKEDIEGSLLIRNIVARMERISDLTANIAEYIIYIAKGKYIKH